MTEQNVAQMLERLKKATPATAPGDASSASNLYRIRSVWVWVRKNGQGKIASAQATRVGERLNPGR
jgi:hypothetical protein